ncbi:N-acetyltransferase [Leifsonia virtsii]|uniref:N-acetyltransferase n=1 Tax=Leifsonia virtsii TaxID=3035915 RepID=A0ABT8ITL8_9MICO|nr:N-acetyltransferase [Leifsonia virtsii]MDN4596164.1 N-acetyltransferase [Leifsonia virtsii]
MLFTHLGSSDIPDRLETGEFVLRPILASDVEGDYDAVMESREYLRPWEQTGWPADDFTLEADLADVTMLEERHAAHHAFTYTMVTPDGSECLGCVYIMPPDARHYREATITPVGDARWEEYGAFVSFWVRTSRLPSRLDERLLAALRDWLAPYHRLGGVLFVTNEQVGQQVELLQRLGLELRFRLAKPTHDGAYLAYGF